MKLKLNEYKCEHCGVVYKKAWSDEEAKQEAEEIFGKHPDNWNDEQVIICDDCFTKMYPPAFPDLLEETKSKL